MSNYKDTTTPLELLMDESEYIDPREDIGIVNQNTGSSVVIRKDGDISISAGKYSQYKMSKISGQTTEIAIKSLSKTVRKEIETDELLINHHKLNPQTYELADMRQALNNESLAIGQFNMIGTVLIKAWEPELQRYVLIRRQIRMPLFSPTLNLADAPIEMGLNTNINDLALSKGDVKI